MKTIGLRMVVNREEESMMPIQKYKMISKGFFGKDIVIGFAFGKFDTYDINFNLIGRTFGYAGYTLFKIPVLLELWNKGGKIEVVEIERENVVASSISSFEDVLFNEVFNGNGLDPVGDITENIIDILECNDGEGEHLVFPEENANVIQTIIFEKQKEQIEEIEDFDDYRKMISLIKIINELADKYNLVD